MLFGALVAEAGMILNCSLTWLPEAFKCEAVIPADIQKGLLLILHALFGNTPLVHSLQRPDKESYFWLFPYSRGIATAGRSACLIWHIFTPDALPDATPEGFMSPPGIKPPGFRLHRDCVNHYIMKTLYCSALWCLQQRWAISFPKRVMWETGTVVDCCTNKLDLILLVKLLLWPSTTVPPLL